MVACGTMPRIQVITLATSTTLSQARVLATSLRRHEPDWPVDILFIGNPASAGLDEALPPPRPVADELDIDLETLIARHDMDDLLTLLVPCVMHSYVKRTATPVLHLPSSAWVLGDLEPVTAALAERSVMLAPRFMGDLPDDNLQPSRKQGEQVGRVCETIMAVDGSVGALEFLKWWRGYVEATFGSLDGSASVARPEDRPWLARTLELAPGSLRDGSARRSRLQPELLEPARARACTHVRWRPRRWPASASSAEPARIPP